MGEMDDIIKEFLVESSDNLDQLEVGLVELEKDPSSHDLLGSIFRAIHTVKGNSGTLGFPKLEAIAHGGENLLSKMRDGMLPLNTEITSGLLRMVDAIRQILHLIEASGTEGDAEYQEVIRMLAELLEQEASRPNQTEEPKLLGQILAERLRVPSDAIDAALTKQREGDLRRIGEILVDQGAVPPGAVLDALKAQAAESGPPVAASNIRVDVSLLDKLMNLVGELVLARNQILQFTTSQKDATFVGTAQRLNLITTELQEGVMKTRMQPIGNVWSKFPRVVRDLAVQFGKQVRIEMEGSETELDKTIIEAIKDPLTHIIRNSIDHGLEMPAARVQAGKPAEGTVSLRAFHEGGQVNIEISDDGCGIDVERVKQKAVERGQLTREQAARLSEREALDLIFLPGVSTAQQVTNISGRGVGMDVVKTNIEKIGGAVDVHTMPKQGTTLKIKIPLTLAIIPALIATAGGKRFAIPQVSLLELVRLEGDQAEKGIENIQGAPVYRLRGHLLPLVYLNQELGLGETTSGSGANIVVLQADEHQFGLVVDEINDTEEIVVKPLSKQLKGIGCFAGATIMGDGKVALILDVLGIAQKANVVTEVRDRAVVDTGARHTDVVAGRDAWLVFTVGGGRRMAIPLAIVARLEEFERERLERSGTQMVVQYRGAIMPLIDIAERSSVNNGDAEKEKLQVVVYSVAGRSVGLVVEQIVDVVEQAVVVEHREEDGMLLGSAVIQERVTDLLNLDALAKATPGQEARA